MDLALGVPEAIRLETGEPNFPTPSHVSEAACRAAHDGFTKYTANPGLASVREAVVEKLARVNGIEATADDVIMTHGALSGLMTSCLATLEPGDEILLPDPGWPNWEMMALTAGGVPRRYPVRKEDGFLPTAELIEPQIGPRAKVLLLNSPSNPTGAVIGPERLHEILELSRQYDLWVISDEVYDEFTFGVEHTCAARLDTDGRVLSVFSLSKTYAMTGWRVGYVVAPPEALPLMKKLQEPVIGCISGVTQKAAEAALRGPQDCVREMRSEYHRRRDLVLDIVGPTGLAASRPDGAFYLMIDVSSAAEDSYSFAKGLLAAKGVAVAPGEAFGPSGRGLVRISLATDPASLVEGVRRLVEYVGQEANS
jgi:aspartate/methionine/tyrosine aminotransferase